MWCHVLLYGQREARCVAHTVSFLVGLLSGESIEIAGCDVKDRNEAVLLCSSIDPFICPSICLSCYLYIYMSARSFALGHAVAYQL